MDIEVTREVLEAMQHAARRAHEREACGILLGKGVRITRFVETSNVHPTPETHFEIDPQALIDANRAARTDGPAVKGYFHSHPKGPARPSSTDAAMSAEDGCVWAIANAEEINFFRAGEGGFEELCTRLIEG